MGKLIKSSEVAKYIGVERQTIMNWEKQGILKAFKNGREWYFSRDAVDELLAPLREISDMKKKVETMKKKVESEYNLYEKYTSYLQEIGIDKYTFQRIVRLAIPAIEKLYLIEGNPLNDNEKKIIKDVLSLKSMRQISVAMKMTEANVNIIINNAINKLLYSKDFERNIKNIVEENYRLNEAIKKMEFENNNLKRMINYEGRLEECDDNKKYAIDIEVQSVNNLGVRTYNCLRQINARNLGMIAALNKNELLRIRNLGKKTYKELESLIKNYGLEFGDEYCRGIYHRRWNGKMYVEY